MVVREARAVGRRTYRPGRQSAEGVGEGPRRGSASGVPEAASGASTVSEVRAAAWAAWAACAACMRLIAVSRRRTYQMPMKPSPPPARQVHSHQVWPRSSNQP
ncbi:hypothetical protein SHIRM173S_09183 [Streptomyces hirsutus]